MSQQSLAELRAAFKQDDKKEGSNGPSNYYRFYDIKEEETCKVRFLPDLNKSNPFGFLVTKVMHNLDINGERKTVPCLSMYGEVCPVCKVSADYYKNKDEVNGKKYWKKKQYIGQVLVVEDPLPADAATGKNSVGSLKFVNLGYQIYNIIQEAFKSDEILDSIPYNFEDGYDFIIKKTKSGKYDAYNIGTTFARRQRSLSEDELAIAAEQMIDLATLLPKNPGVEKVQAMLDAALLGTTYEEDAPAAAARSAQAAAQRADESEEIPFDVPVRTPAPAVTPAPAAASAESSEDIEATLALVRARRAAAAANKA
jgi:hypothetical protein